MKRLKSLLWIFMVWAMTANFAYAQSTTTQQTSVASINTATVKVKGITCSTDLSMISTNVEKLNGVRSCEAGKQGPTSTFEITYNPALVTAQDIYAAIENTASCEDPDERPYKVKL